MAAAMTGRGIQDGGGHDRMEWVSKTNEHSNSKDDEVTSSALSYKD